MSVKRDNWWSYSILYIVPYNIINYIERIWLMKTQKRIEMFEIYIR